jgi:hypothetical protein
MKRSITFILLIICCCANAQKEKLAKTSAGFPVNYEEDSVGSYVLPDLLTTTNGQRIKTARAWTEKRRPELLKLVDSLQYGKMPKPLGKLNYQVFDKGTLVMDGKAIRKQVTIYFTSDTADYKMDLLIYLPISNKPVPLLLNISFVANNQTVDDAAVKVGYIWTKEGNKIKADQPSRFSKMNVQQFIDAGIGFATVYYGDIEPDFKTGFKYGIRGQYLKAGQNYPANDEWGAISAWAWGLSRAMDYFEQDKQIDSKRIAVQGASRLGKTALWTGIHDERFKLVIASISGEGGAALAKRNYGENIKHITDTSRYFYQFAANYHSYSTKIDSLPFDAHALIALMAPRPLLLQTGDSDYWSDPKGEFLAAKVAEPVYKLFGKDGPGNTEWPAAGDTSLLMNTLGYYMHKGGHTVLPEDWTLFIQYMKKFL